MQNCRSGFWSLDPQSKIGDACESATEKTDPALQTKPLLKPTVQIFKTSGVLVPFHKLVSCNVLALCPLLTKSGIWIGIVTFCVSGDRVYISVRRGLMCTDSHQPDHRCADYTVRFYCPGMKALCRSAGETSSTSNHTESSPSEAQNHNNSEHKFLSQKDKTKPHNEVMKVENAKNDTFGEGGGEQEKEKRDNMTKKEKKKKRVELYLGEAVPDSGAAFHKHLLWNDRQTERRRKEQFVYSQWKSRRGLHHQYKLVNW